ncbi:MAG: hypothetical protein P4L82_00465 [Ancalomicrobiaceae bacterium]|nr:hypothetical protein [Ancalomicrobiaceae bacterium]
MAEAVLVDADVNAGLELVKLLDESQFNVKSAAWIYYPEREEWKLLIATPRAAQDLSAAYYDVVTVLRRNKDLDDRFDSTRIRVVRPDEPSLEALSRLVKADGLQKLRYTHNAIDGYYIDDALIYRLAA